MNLRPLLYALLLTGVLAPSASWAQRAAAPANALATQARDLIAAGKPGQAVLKAREAIRQQDSDYRGHYYLALALVALNDSAGAAGAIDAALARAPDEAAKAAVLRLQASRQGPVNGDEADRALADGLFAKAARLYIGAWEQGTLTPAKTVAAAQVLEKQLNDTATAARMYAQVAAQNADAAAADRAAAQLVRLKPVLGKLSEEALAAARKHPAGSVERKRWTEQALALDADNLEARTELLNVMADADDWPALQRQFMQLHRQGKLRALLDSGKLRLGLLQTKEGLPTLLADIWGPDVAKALLAKNGASGNIRQLRGMQQSAENHERKVMAAFKAEGLVAGTGQPFKDCAECPELVWLAPGTLPVIPQSALLAATRDLRIPYPLAVGRFELTFEEWDHCVAAGACRADVPESENYGLLFNTKLGRGRQPLSNILLSDARSYLAWLGTKTGHSYRLLTLPEFIYAARTGKGEGHLLARANCVNCGAGESQAVKVGSFEPNAWGLHDMIGNLAEFTEPCDRNAAGTSAPALGQTKSVDCAYPGSNLRAMLAQEFPKMFGPETLAMAAAGGAWAPHAGGTLEGISLYIPIKEEERAAWFGLRVAREYSAR